MELHLVLEGARDLAVQIHRQLRDAILSGRLAGGTRLPPSRLLAEQLGVSRKTVSQAYERLALEKLIVTQVGAGSTGGLIAGVLLVQLVVAAIAFGRIARLYGFASLVRDTEVRRQHASVAKVAAVSEVSAPAPEEA